MLTYILQYFKFEKQEEFILDILLFNIKPPILRSYFCLDNDTNLLLNELFIENIENIYKYNYKYFSVVFSKDFFDLGHEKLINSELDRFCQLLKFDKNNLTSEQLKEFHSAIIRGFAKTLTNCESNCDSLNYFKNKINQHLLIMSILRLGSILILLNIVLYLNF